MAKRRPYKFIQATGISKPGHRGALHRALGIPQGEHIPLPVARRAAKAPGKLGRQARFYVNVLSKLPHHVGPLGTRRVRYKRRAHHGGGR